MAMFIPDNTSGVPISTQWREHLQQQEYVNDLTTAIGQTIEAYNDLVATQKESSRQNATTIVTALQEATNEQVSASYDNTAIIVGAIENLSESVSRAQYDVGARLNATLERITDQTRVGNLLLRNLGELLRVPDFQKERLYYIEQGLKHYKNALIDPALMGDALSNFLKAEEREKTDYVVLHRIGMIYLYSHDHLDVRKAEDYFVRAGRYAAVESEPAAARLALILCKDDVGGDPENLGDSGQIARLAAHSYLQASTAAYLQENYGRALEHARRAVKLKPGWAVGCFKEAKYLALRDRAEEATAILEPLIRADRHVAVLVASDVDLSHNRRVNGLLELLKHEAKGKVETTIAKIEKSIREFNWSGINLVSELDKLHALRDKGDYLSLQSAIDIGTSILSQIEIWEVFADDPRKHP